MRVLPFVLLVFYAEVATATGEEKRMLTDLDDTKHGSTEAASASAEAYTGMRTDIDELESEIKKYEKSSNKPAPEFEDHIKKSDQNGYWKVPSKPNWFKNFLTW